MGVPPRTPEGCSTSDSSAARFITAPRLRARQPDNNCFYALNKLRRFETAGKVNKYEGWEMMSLVWMTIRFVAFDCDSCRLWNSHLTIAVIMATSGPGRTGKSTNSDGFARSFRRHYQRGAKYAEPANLYKFTRPRFPANKLRPDV